MNLLVPKMYQESIYTIPYQNLKNKKIKCLLFDLDNTCVGYHEKKPTKKLKMLFSNLQKQGFQVIIFSNAPRRRLIPFQKLGVVCHASSKKPFQRNFKILCFGINLRKYSVIHLIAYRYFTERISFICFVFA